MKILQLTSRFRIGGIASYIQILSSALKKRGHEVFVCATPGTAVGQLENDRISFVPVDLATKFEWHPKLWAAEREVEQLVFDQKMDIIHAHTRVAQVLADRISRKLGKPMVSTCHGFYAPRLGRRLFPCLGDRVIAISPEVSEHLKRVMNVDERNISVVLNAVPVKRLLSSLESQNRAELRKQFGFSESDFILGNVARLEKVKGHAFLLEALGKLKDTFPSLKLMIVGSGNEKHRLEKIVAEKQLTERVLFAGEMADIVPALRVMDAFVSPHTWEEGFGLSIAEALVCGLPIIASRTGALKKLIRDRETGILVDAGRSDVLAEAISSLISDLSFRSRIARQGQTFAQAAFSPDRMAKEIERVYENVIARGARGATKQSASSEIASASFATLPRNDELCNAYSKKVVAC